MSQLQSRRLLLYLVNKNSRFRSTLSANPPKGPILSSASLLDKQSPPIPPPIPPPDFEKEHDPWIFLKLGIFASLTGATATVGYATYG